MTKQRIFRLVLLLSCLGIGACENQSSTLLFSEPRVRACITFEDNTTVEYFGWPVQDQHSLEVLGQIEMTDTWRSVNLVLDIPSRQEALSTTTPLPICKRKEDPPCDEVEEAYVLASYREYSTDVTGGPKPVFDSDAEGGTVTGSLDVAAAEQDSDATPVSATFDITFTVGGKTRHLVNGGVGVYTSPPDDTGDCPPAE